MTTTLATRAAVLAAALLVTPLLGCTAGRVSTAAPAPAAAAPQAAAPAAPAQPPGTPDSALGLSRTSVFDVPAPPLFHDEESTPGEKPLVPRVNPIAPPVIPHGIEAFDPIRRDANVCVDCHMITGPKVAGEATPIPASHYVDLRRAPAVKGAKLAGARFVCTACHVARTDAPPLVGSSYRP
jgi:hypothetical protein